MRPRFYLHRRHGGGSECRPNTHRRYSHAGIAAILERDGALRTGKNYEISLVIPRHPQLLRVAKALARADAIAIGHSVPWRSRNKHIDGVTTSPPRSVKRTLSLPHGSLSGRVRAGSPLRKLDDKAAERVYNFLHTLTMEAQMLARACGKTNIHSLEPEDLAALTLEASAMCKVPLAGTNYTVGVDNYHTY